MNAFDLAILLHSYPFSALSQVDSDDYEKEEDVAHTMLSDPKHEGHEEGAVDVAPPFVGVAHPLVGSLV